MAVAEDERFLVAVKPPRVPESTEQSHIVQLLRRIFGAQVWELGTKRSRRDFHMGTRQTPGLPDLICFLPQLTGGQQTGWDALVVECKAAGGKLRPEQIVFRQCCLGARIAHVVGGYDDVVAWLIDHKYARPEQFPTYRRPKVAL